MHDDVILVNLEDSVCHALARCLRAEHICCHIVPATTTADDLLRQESRGVILAKGYSGQAADFPGMMDYLQIGLPMLCLGDAALTLCQALGGTLAPESEGGVLTVAFDKDDSLFDDVENGERYLPVYRGMLFGSEQGDACATANDAVVGIHVRQRIVWGLAFPLERNDPATAHLLVNFCCAKCGCTPWWTEQAFISQAIDGIREAAEGGYALCALSGGVDSGVSALLGHAALGQQLHCLFVDTGLLRDGEADEVMAVYQQEMGLNVRRIDARAECLLALKDHSDPDEKTRIVHNLLQEVVRREVQALPGIKLILLGTNYSDTPMEENDADYGPAVKVLEPVKELFKDEIRHVGELLGLPPVMTSRQPFPGSGLACRIMATVTAERLDILRTADAIFRREVDEAGLNRRLWQYYAALALSPLPRGGLMVILRAVQASEGGAGMPARIPSDLLERVTAKVMCQCPDVERVFYDCTPSKSYAKQVV